jgi:hypothetical protein
MGDIIFKNPLTLEGGTGFTVNPDGEPLQGISLRTVTFSIPQAVSPSSSVVFDVITPTDIVKIDNGALILSNSGITGSFIFKSYCNGRCNYRRNFNSRKSRNRSI